MTLKRRELLQHTIGLSLAALATPTLFAQDPDTSFYRDSIVIDGLGGPGGLGQDENALLNAQELQDAVESGITAVNMTLGTVGTTAPLAAF